jgi:hypothetical protein
MGRRWLFLALLLLLSSTARAAEPPVVAVLDLEDTTGDFTARLPAMTKTLRAKLAATKLVRPLAAAKQKKVDACRTDACLSAIARDLEVDGVIVAKITESGASYWISAEVITFGVTLNRRRAVVVTEGTNAAMTDALDRLADHLTGTPAPIDSTGGTADASDGVMTFESVPPGATVWIDGVQLKNPTPCDDYLPVGRAKVKFGGLVAYQDVEAPVELRAGGVVTGRLQPRLGELVVVARDANGALMTGIDVYVDGRIVGKAPLRLPGLLAGAHVVLLGEESTFGAPRKVVVDGTKPTRVELTTPDVAAPYVGSINAQLEACLDASGKVFASSPKVSLDASGMLLFTTPRAVTQIPWYDVVKLTPEITTSKRGVDLLVHAEGERARLGSLSCFRPDEAPERLLKHLEALAKLSR